MYEIVALLTLIGGGTWVARYLRRVGRGTETALREPEGTAIIRHHGY